MGFPDLFTRNKGAPEIPPPEQSITSTPCSPNFSDRITESSISQPFSIPSTADILQNNGISSGITERTASTTSSKRRIRP